ncbi:hypothetical protein HCJ66_10270 [Listeria sp. FSL L7-1582]|uniref:hypothetical protein n=1 Tax=Listeria portnoyi TaxID=2713504 RepID=UPI00164DE685|nr:hypothetical protein [Listeria portnoyi]MBC6309926.1 hypothetical protein [Listeria portnoyi]
MIKKMKSIGVLFVLVLLAGCVNSGSDKTMENIKAVNSSIYPTSDFNVKKAMEKGIGEKESYANLQNIYMYYLGQYLNSLYDFKRTDDILNTQSFQTVGKKDYYQQLSQIDSQYFYIRNNIHCERLDEKSINYLKKIGKREQDEEARSIIEKTYVDVLSIQFENAGKEYDTSYEKSNSGNRRVKNTDLVLYVKYANVKKDDANYVLEGNREAKIISEVSEEVKIGLEKKLSCGISIFNISW